RKRVCGWCVCQFHHFRRDPKIRVKLDADRTHANRVDYNKGAEALRVTASQAMDRLVSCVMLGFLRSRVEHIEAAVGRCNHLQIIPGIWPSWIRDEFVCNV